MQDHIDHARAFVEAIGLAPGRCLDLGSGGGVPGLILAGHWPLSEWTLLEAALRRTTFLERAVTELGLETRVSVVRGRAEELGRNPDHRSAYTLVTSRSFGPPAVAAECGSAFLAVGGRMVVSEPPMSGAAVRWPSEALCRLGLQDSSASPGPVRVLTCESLLDARFPRRVGIPSKRPLW